MKLQHFRRLPWIYYGTPEKNSDIEVLDHNEFTSMEKDNGQKKVAELRSAVVEDSVEDNNKEQERGKQSGLTGADLIRMIFNPPDNGNSMKRLVDYSSDSSECENEDSKLPEKQPCKIYSELQEAYCTIDY